MVEKWVILKIGLAVLLLGGAGVGLSLATRIYDPLWNPFRPEPAKILSELTQAQEKIKTSYYQGTIRAEAKEDTTELFHLTLDFEGDSDNTDPENLKSAANFGMKVGSEGMEFSFSAELKTIGDTAYLKLTEIPFLPMLGMMGIPYENIKGQWIKMESEEIEAETQETQEELIEKMKEILEGRKFFLLKKELPDEKIEGRKVYHYLVVLDKEEVKEVIPEILEEVMKATGEELYMLSEKEKQEMVKYLDEFLEKIGEIEAQIWIDKKSLFVRRVKLEKEIDMKALTEGEGGRLVFSMELNSSGFNQPVEIEAPEEAKTLEEIFPSVPSPYLPEVEPEYYEFEEWPKEYPGLLSLPFEELWTLGGLASMVDAFEAVLRSF